MYKARNENVRLLFNLLRDVKITCTVDRDLLKDLRATSGVQCTTVRVRTLILALISYKLFEGRCHSPSERNLHDIGNTYRRLILSALLQLFLVVATGVQRWINM